MAVLTLEDVSKAVEDLRREILALRSELETVKAAAAAAAASEDISPELLVLLGAAATAYLGKKVRVRSAKMLQTPYEIVNPWAQQGRVFVQASHQLQRGH